MLDVLDWSKNWDHQNRCHLAMDTARAAGKRAVVAAAPPGAGKSRVMFQRAHRELERGGYVLLGVHRSLLLQQMIGYAENLGLPYGVIEAGTQPDLSKRFQVASIPTLYSWVVKRGSLDMPPATLAIWDEAHANTKDQTRSLFYGAHDGITRIQGLVDRGAFVEGYTGSPVNLGGLYDELTVCGTYKELREVKAHAMVAVYGPEEIDVEDLKLDDEGEYSSKKLEPRAFAIWGSVYDWWQKLNPFALPALLFGPSAPGARWFALEFIKRGVTAGYIGADCVMLPGHLPCGTLCLDTYPSTTETRGQALELSRTGGIKVLCNRFVLREAIDMPWIKHGIAATVFGGLATYLQSVGRVQRYFAAYGDEPKIWQCHGGCLDDQTEVLTREGWKGIGQVTTDDYVAGFDVETNAIRWAKARSTYVREVNDHDVMHTIKSRSLDIRVTGNHKAILKRRTCDKNDRQVWPEKFIKVRFDEAATFGRFKIPVAAEQVFDGVALTDYELRFLGWWITDGTRQLTNVSISQKEGPRCDDIREVLAGCGFHWTETFTWASNKKCRYRMVKFNIPKGTCKSKPRAGWQRLEKWLDKKIHEDLDAMDSRQFAVFLHAIHLGDGAKDRLPGSYRVACGNRTMVDRLQSMAVRRGWKCNFTWKQPRCATIDLQKTTDQIVSGSQAKGNQARIKTSTPIPGERVWCVENEFGTLVTRRNGKVAIVGNSFWRHGSPNAERHWYLGCTNRDLAKLRKERVEKAADPQQVEGIQCPRCHGWRTSGPQCPHCNHMHKRSVRFVRQVDGALVKMQGAATKVKKKKQLTEQAIWNGVLYGSVTVDRPVSSAVAMFYARAKAAGIQHPNVQGLVNPPPMRDTKAWHSLVKDVYPDVKPRRNA